MLKYLKNRILFGKYKVIKEIGKGSFGSVFKGENILDNSLVAIKVENRNAKNALLGIECNFLSILKGYGIPEVKSYGYHGKYCLLIQELLGNNLMQIKHSIKRFSLKDIVMMGIQIMDRIEYVHSKNIIHRDIKPENFVVGYNDDTTLYIIDFGISKKYRSNRKHLKFQLLGKMFGTVRYSSYNASRGVEQSRRDDLESIGYMLVYLATGKLPWQGLIMEEHNRAKKYLEMLLLKKYISNEEICNKLPSEFSLYLKYCKSLSFEQDPDYEFLRNLFRSILLRMNTINDSIFTWTQRKKKSKDKNLNTNKYINFLRRKESSQTRLYKAIQNSLEKSDKNKKFELAEKKNIIEIKNNENTHIRGISDETTKSTKFEKIENTNIDKSEFSYDSLVAHFNMNVIGFQDENKMYEENIKRINSIKNKKSISYSNDLNSYKYKKNNIAKINQNIKNECKNSENIDCEKYRDNLKLSLKKITLNLAKEFNNDRKINSEKVKSKYRLYMNKLNFISKSEEKKLIINNYLNSLIKVKNNLKPKSNILNNINETKMENNEPKNRMLLSNEESFTFKNFNIINRNHKSSEINVNKINESKKINSYRLIRKNNNNKIQYVNNNINFKYQDYKGIKNSPIRTKVNNSYTDRMNVNISNSSGNKNILKNNNNINIIINNNLNNFKRLSLENKTNFTKYQTYKPHYKIISNSQKNMLNMDIIQKNIFNNNNIYNGDTKTLNYINRIPKNNKRKIENIKLIPNITKPFQKNYFLQNQNNVMNNSIKNNNNDINNQMKNNNIPKVKKVKLLEYKPLHYNNQNSLILNSQKYDSYKKIINTKNKIQVFPGKIQIIQLDNKNNIKTSPSHYNNIRNNKKLLYENNNTYTNIFNNNDLYSYNISRHHMKLENSHQMNNNRNLYIPIEKKRIFHHYSPINKKINSNSIYYLRNSNENFIHLFNKRNNSYQTYKNCLNYDFNNIDELYSYNYTQKGFNNLKFDNTNKYISKCYNIMNIQ